MKDAEFTLFPVLLPKNFIDGYSFTMYNARLKVLLFPFFLFKEWSVYLPISFYPLLPMTVRNVYIEGAELDSLQTHSMQKYIFADRCLIKNHLPFFYFSPVDFGNRKSSVEFWVLLWG